MRLQLQSFIFDKFGAAANDLEDGDSGIDGRAVRRRRLADTGADDDADATNNDKAKKRQKKCSVEIHGLVNHVYIRLHLYDCIYDCIQVHAASVACLGHRKVWEWDKDALFEIDCLVGKMVADGAAVPGQQVSGRAPYCT